MTRTKQQELEQAQNLHLIRDERDLELETREIPPGPSFWPSRC